MYSQSIQITYQLPELIMGSSFLTESFFFCTETSALCYAAYGLQWKVESTHSRKQAF